MIRFILIFIPFVILLLTRAALFVLGMPIVLARWAILASRGRWRSYQFWATASTSETAASLSKGVSVNLKYIGGWRPLHVAAAYNSDSGVIAALLDNNADIHARHGGGRMPSHVAARQSVEPGVIEVLLDGGANIEATTSFLNMTPLYLAATYNPKPGIVTILLDKGALVDARTDTGMTPLLGAAA